MRLVQLTPGEGTLVLTTENEKEREIVRPLVGRSFTVTVGDFKEARYIDHTQGCCLVIPLASSDRPKPQRDARGRFLPPAGDDELRP